MWFVVKRQSIWKFEITYSQTSQSEITMRFCYRLSHFNGSVMVFSIPFPFPNMLYVCLCLVPVGENNHHVRGPRLFCELWVLTSLLFSVQFSLVCCNVVNVFVVPCPTAQTIVIWIKISYNLLNLFKFFQLWCGGCGSVVV